jgi:hypothetical protein
LAQLRVNKKSRPGLETGRLMLILAGFLFLALKNNWQILFIAKIRQHWKEGPTLGD